MAARISNRGETMSDYLGTWLWKSTFKDQGKSSADTRSRLANIYKSIRQRSAELLQTVSTDMPGLTKHDITHSDALWEMADLIVGRDYALTLLEGFVFGVAALVHDTGLSLQAYENGLESIKETPLWRNLVARALRAQGLASQQYDLADLRALPPAIVQGCLFQFLRKKHGDTAIDVVQRSWTPKNENRQQEPRSLHLIADEDARRDLGHLIGQIAASHTRDTIDIVRLQDLFNPPAWCADAGTVRPTVVAALLRCADAINLDARRAPIFSEALASISPDSQTHWDFQSRLAVPTLSDDAILFTAGRPFAAAERGAWWHCYDALRAAHGELQAAARILEDKRVPPFRARRVSHVEGPDAFATVVPTEGWIPARPRINVSNAAKMIRELGGLELYRGKKWCCIRELIQNACDAVRARRVLEKRGAAWGDIRISCAEEKEGAVTLAIADNGIGMSPFVLKNYLLDFFKSYWESDDAVAIDGDLSAFKSIGRFGIGFFSVFMLSRVVDVRSRPIDSVKTYCLRFDNGLDSDPIIVVAEGKDRLIDPGTEIRFVIPSEEWKSMLDDVACETLAEFVAYVAPAVDVDLTTSESEGAPSTMKGGSWRDIPPKELLLRISPELVRKLHPSPDRANPAKKTTERERKALSQLLELNAALLAPVVEKGDCIGRLAPCPDYSCLSERPEPRHRISRSSLGYFKLGIITCGGLRIGETNDFAGLVEGDVTGASRLMGSASISHAATADWCRRVESNLLAANCDLDKNLFDETYKFELYMKVSGLVITFCDSATEIPLFRDSRHELIKVSDLKFLSEFDEVFIIERYPAKKIARDFNKDEIIEKFGEDKDSIFELIFDIIEEDVPRNVLVRLTSRFLARETILFDLSLDGKIYTDEDSTSRLFHRMKEDTYHLYNTDYVAVLHILHEIWGADEVEFDAPDELEIPLANGGSTTTWQGARFRRKSKEGEAK
jgi:hypothetical protein